MLTDTDNLRRLAVKWLVAAAMLAGLGWCLLTLLPSLFGLAPVPWWWVLGGCALVVSVVLLGLSTGWAQRRFRGRGDRY